MGREELKATLEAELKQAEQRLNEARLEYAQIKKAYLAVANPPEEGKRTRENLKKLVLEALERVPQEFTVRMLFERMERPDLTFKNVRPRLTMWLKKLEEENVLMKTGRGRFAMLPQRRLKKQ